MGRVQPNLPRKAEWMNEEAYRHWLRTEAARLDKDARRGLGQQLKELFFKPRKTK